MADIKNIKINKHFKDLFDVSIDTVYSTIGIPHEVALDKFGGSFSSTRADLISWKYKMTIEHNMKY